MNSTAKHPWLGACGTWLQRALPVLLLGVLQGALAALAGGPLAWGLFATWAALDLLAAFLAGWSGVAGTVARVFLAVHLALGAIDLIGGFALTVGGALGMISGWVGALLVCLGLGSIYHQWLSSQPQPYALC